MLALIGGLRGAVMFGLGAFVAGTIAYQAGHALGYSAGDHAGYARAQDAARERAMALMNQRSKDNEEIGDMDRAGLCGELGGVWLPAEGRCD